MARDNYSYQKYRRELAKKKKKEEKLQRKLDKKKDGSGKIPEQVPGDVTSVISDQIPYGQGDKVQ